MEERINRLEKQVAGINSRLDKFEGAIDSIDKTLKRSNWLKLVEIGGIIIGVIAVIIVML